MSDFEYNKMIEQILNRKDVKEREELFNFIGDKGDDRFVEPLLELIQLEDSPLLRQSLYVTFTKIGTDLANEVITKEVKVKLPRDDGKKIPKKIWAEAVNFLANNMDRSFIRKIEQQIETEGKFWSTKNKSDGIYIRNLLRNNGYNWGEKSLEIYWPWIVEDAINKYRTR